MRKLEEELVAVPRDALRLFKKPFEIRKVGSLSITSGKIAACDPLSMTGRKLTPLDKRVPKGDHAVYTSLATFPLKRKTKKHSVETRCAGASVWFGRRGAIAKLVPTKPSGYGVDAGTGCFLDAANATLLEEEPELERLTTDLLTARELGFSSAVIETKLIAFTSGYGDGVYESFWGFDKDGALRCLVTDFGL